MGTNYSMPLPDAPSNDFMMLSIKGYNRLVLLYGGLQEQEAVRSAICQNWVKGIQKEKVLLDDDSVPPKAFQFKLNGWPFIPKADKSEALAMRRMVAMILQSLRNMGWQLMVSSDLSVNTDMATWVFLRQVVSQDTQRFMVIGISSTDKLQIVDCPHQLYPVIRDVVMATWVNGVQGENNLDEFTNEIKLKGHPWGFVNKQESCSARHMLKEIIKELSKRQWVLYANSNLKLTADTMFFRFDPNAPTDSDFCTISLNRKDRIRLIHFNDSITAAIEETVRNTWKEVQEVIDERPFCYEMKLKGTPWWADGMASIHSRMLVVRLMEQMAACGYFVTTGIDITRKINDKSLLLFQRGNPLRTQFCCLSLNESDKVRFLNAPSNIVSLACQVVREKWLAGIQKEEKMQDGVTHEMKLNGNPWYGLTWHYGVHGRALLINLLYHFTVNNWRLVCSADVSAMHVKPKNSPARSLDAHSWYFMYDETMQASPLPMLPDLNQPFAAM